MARVGFEPTNPKERFYRPLRLTRLRYRAKMLPPLQDLFQQVLLERRWGQQC